MAKQSTSHTLSRELRVIFILVGLSLLPLLNLFHSGMFVAHDSIDHVARIANFALSLSEGNWIPRWAGNLNWGYGHPILMFLYPLPSYVAAVFHAVGFSFVDSTKLIFAVSYTASILTMYVWLRAHFDKFSSFIGALLYGFAPYRFVDLYVRGAIGEHVAFIFPPLLYLALYRLTSEKRSLPWFLLLATATASLILSHNALSIMFLAFGFMYAAYIFFAVTKHKKRFFILSITGIVFGFMLSSFFWIPAFFEGKYTLRDIVTKGEFGDRFVPILWFFYSPWNYSGGNFFSKEIGIVQWVGVIGSLLGLTAGWQKKKWLTGICFITLCISMFLMTPAAGTIWQKVTLLQKFQFPWRLLSICVLVVAVLGAAFVETISIKKKRLAACLFVIAVLASTRQMWVAKSYTEKPEASYSGIYKGTTDTGESSPIWSVRFMEHEPDAPVEMVQGNGTVTTIERKIERHVYAVDVKSEKARLLDNTLYFPGWTVIVDGAVVTPFEIWFQDPEYRGLINFWLTKGPHKVDISFHETKLRKFANALSASAVSVLLLLIVLMAAKRGYIKKP